MRRTFWLYLAVVVVGVILGLLFPSEAGGAAVRGSDGRNSAGTPIAATYKGLTTTRAYQPLATTAPGPATQGRPSVTTYPSIHVEPLNDELRRSYRLNAFYTKTLTIRGVVIVGSDKVSDWAFLEAAYTIDHMFMNSPRWITEGFAASKVHLAIIADVEYTMDLPENQTPDMIANGAYNDRRSRGLGGFPWCSCAEENLLNLRGDPYGGSYAQSAGAGSENITIHEFSHTTANMIGSLQGGRNRTGGPFWDGLRKAFADANLPGGRLGQWNAKHTDKVYASTNEQEYWAEGAQAWFDNANPENSGGLAVRADVKTRDAELAALLTQIYGDGPWRYIKTTARKADRSPLRPADEFAHLVGLDAVRPRFPVFDYNNSPRIRAAATQGAAAASRAG